MSESRLPRLYGELATQVLNTLVVLVGVNVLLAVVFAVRDRKAPTETDATAAQRCPDAATYFGADGAPCDNGRRTPYQLRWFDFRAYGAAGDAAKAAEVLDAFRELGALGFAYQPWVEFSEPPFRSRLVNVDTDAAGLPLRRTVDLSRPLATDTLVVVVLGGSTTFGYDVADEETWPSWLSRALNERLVDHPDVAVVVRNYGRGYYYPTQEVALLGDILRSGLPADLVIFMDGVNLGPAPDVPILTDEFVRRFRLVQSGAGAGLERFEWIPMVRLALAIRRRANGTADGAQAVEASAPPPSTDHLAERFRANREMARGAASAFGVPVLFFLQPDAVYNYPLTSYRRPPPESFLAERRDKEDLYPLLRADSGWIDLTGLFERWSGTGPSIVDDVHYGPGFNRFLAEAVAPSVPLEALLDRRKEEVRVRVSTGGPRAPISP